MIVLAMLKAMVVLMFLLAHKQKIWRRSMTMYILTVSFALWAIADGYCGDYALVFIMVGMLIAYARAMFKGEGDKMWYGVHHV